MTQSQISVAITIEGYTNQPPRSEAAEIVLWTTHPFLVVNRSLIELEMTRATR